MSIFKKKKKKLPKKSTLLDPNFDSGAFFRLRNSANEGDTFTYGGKKYIKAKEGTMTEEEYAQYKANEKDRKAELKAGNARQADLRAEAVKKPVEKVKMVTYGGDADPEQDKYYGSTRAERWTLVDALGKAREPRNVEDIIRDAAESMDRTPEWVAGQLQKSLKADEMLLEEEMWPRLDAENATESAVRKGVNAVLKKDKK